MVFQFTKDAIGVTEMEKTTFSVSCIFVPVHTINSIYNHSFSVLLLLWQEGGDGLQRGLRHASLAFPLAASAAQQVYFHTSDMP